MPFNTRRSHTYSVLVTHEVDGRIAEPGVAEHGEPVCAIDFVLEVDVSIEGSFDPNADCDADGRRGRPLWFTEAPTITPHDVVTLTFTTADGRVVDEQRYTLLVLDRYLPHVAGAVRSALEEWTRVYTIDEDFAQLVEDETDAEEYEAERRWEASR